MRPIGPISADFSRIASNATDRSHPAILVTVKPTDSSAELGAAIRERRRRLGISQDELAVSIHVNRKVIGQLENGKETVHVGIALRAANAVGLNVGVEPRG